MRSLELQLFNRINNLDIVFSINIYRLLFISLDIKLSEATAREHITESSLKAPLLEPLIHCVM